MIMEVVYSIVMGMMKLGNILPKAGLEPTSLLFRDM